MDSWKRLNEASSPDKKVFYRSVNMKNVTNADYKHAKKVRKKNFK